MMLRTTMIRYCLLLLLLLCFTTGSSAQSFDFKTYNSEIGLPQNYIYSIKQGKKGYLWIGTGEGLVRYDGFNFDVYTSEDSLADDFINNLLIDKKGTIWCGHKNGNLSYYKDEQFHKIIIDETTQKINDIKEDENGNIWAIEQRKGLISINKDGEVKTYFGRKKFGIRNYVSLAVITPWKFLVGSSEGLFMVTFTDSGYDNVDVTLVQGIPETRINTIVPSKGGTNDFWIGTDGAGFYHFTYNSGDTRHISDNKLCLTFNIEREKVNDIFEDQDGHLLIATKSNGVIKLFYNPKTGSYSESMNFSTINGLNVDYITQILCDREGNYWFGTYGGGVASLINQSFVFYNIEEIGFKSQKVYSVLKAGHELWLGLDNGLIKHDPLCFTDFEFYDPALGIPRDRITKIEKDNEGRIWVATAENGLYYRPVGELRFRAYNFTSSQSGKVINDIHCVGDQIYIASSEGLYLINTKTKAKSFYDMGHGLSHNTINFIYEDRDGLIWVGTKDNGICSIEQDKIERHKLMQSAVNVIGMTEDKDGNKWLATKNKGVLLYTVDSIKAITIKDGLKKNYCYSINCDSKNKLWVCHHVGLSSIDLETGQIRTFDHEDQMDGEFNQVVKGGDGTLWMASSDGVVHYNPEVDNKNNVAPLLNLTSVRIDDVEYPTNEPINLPYQKYYNLRLEFRAISFVNPEAVTYEFRIDDVGSEKQDKDWTKLKNINFKEIDYLSYGRHKVRIRAYNADGVCTATPLVLSINVAKPFWIKAWFIAAMLLVLGVIVYGIIKFRERKLQQQKQMLQREVDSQTVVLREQKEEIERKNRDITDSINYAKKIQSSILPPMNDLIAVLPESYIYFLPRDIVSGDFYWFCRTGDNLVICCADCTGHGVPGGFMSMIGTTILNDIFRFKDNYTPADVLEKLDNEIKKLLQKSEEQQSNDGMDISVINIHLPSRKVKLASARRPIYMVINNELTMYKGNRRSIGDNFNTEEENQFVNIEYNCSKGDHIYLFSDGYPDQFGGPLGKKFMKTGVRSLIEEIYELPSAEQYQKVKSNFEDWKGDLDQIDDVLFMGIKL